MGKPLGDGRALVWLLQLLPRPQIAQDDARNGRWHHRLDLERAQSPGGRLIEWQPVLGRPPPNDPGPTGNGRAF